VSKELDEFKEKLDKKRLEIERLKEELKSTKESLKKQNDSIDFDLLSSPINKIILDTEVTILAIDANKYRTLMTYLNIDLNSTGSCCLFKRGGCGCFKKQEYRGNNTNDANRYF